MVNEKKNGEVLRKLRKDRKMSVNECCAIVGVSPSAWRMYETGDRTPRDEVKYSISALFNRSIKFIFFNE